MWLRSQFTRMNTRVYIYNLNDTVDSYEVTYCGITAIGYQFVDKDTGKTIIIHPSTVKRIEEEASLAPQAPQKQ